MRNQSKSHLPKGARPIRDRGPLTEPPAEVLAVWEYMRGLAIPDETVDFVAETLAQHPNDGFVMRTAHLAGPLLDIVLQKSHWDTSEYIAVQSFPLWLGVPYKKALALGHTVGELLFLFGHGVAVALVDSRGRGVAFRVTGTDGFFVASEIIELAPSGKTL